MIRPADAGDVEAIGQLWVESARAAFTPLLPEGHPLPDPQPDRMHARLEDGEVSVIVSQQQGTLDGFVVCGVSRDPDPEPGVGEVQSFFVRAGTWRRGIGRALMKAALEDLRQRGYTAATVWSFDANARANAFYEGHGFERDGATRTEDAWARIPEVRYRRTLP